MIHATIQVMPKQGVLDPQGEAVRRALVSQGLTSVAGVRVGKFIEIELSGEDTGSALGALEQACKEILSNPVVEDFTLQVTVRSNTGKKSAPTVQV